MLVGVGLVLRGVLGSALLVGLVALVGVVLVVVLLTGVLVVALVFLMSSGSIMAASGVRTGLVGLGLCYLLHRFMRLWPKLQLRATVQVCSTLWAWSALM